MDLAFFANMLMFLGVFGGSLLLDSSSSSSSSEDPLYDRDDYTDTENGTSGNDDLSTDKESVAWFLNGGEDRLEGSEGDDYANLGSGDDHADMGAGNDIALGGDGNDAISGGNGFDRLFGDAGNDALNGNLGDDQVSGDAGDDTLLGGSGNDILSGGLGNDVLSGFDLNTSALGGMTSADGADQLFGGEGNDSLLLGHGDVAAGGAGDDSFVLDHRFNDAALGYRITDYTAGSDQIEVLYTPRFDAATSAEIAPDLQVELSPDGQSSLIRLNGSIIAQIDGATDLSAADITLTADHLTDPHYAPAAYSAEVLGTAATDTLTGNSAGTAWFAGAGDDHLTGSTAADYARLGDGDDQANMGAGNDMAHGDAGNDAINGEAGSDTILGDAGNDSVGGDDGNDFLAGQLGDDHIWGGAGADNISGGGGDDTLSGFGDNAGAADGMTAIDGIDSLAGGQGADTLILGHGDVATGGAGADTFALDFRYDEGPEVCLITDYTHGIDQIELHYSPVFDGTGTEIPPVLSITFGPGNAYALLNLDGVQVAQLTGAAGLTTADITLMPTAA
ncbi:MAG: hypothetical protein KBF27_01820 [Cypionkella sp.]|nr:hypothetical protein [Cypionkella sp.]